MPSVFSEKSSVRVPVVPDRLAQLVQEPGVPVIFALYTLHVLFFHLIQLRFPEWSTEGPLDPRNGPLP